MVIQVVIRLTLYIDQSLLKQDMYVFQHGIENTVSVYLYLHTLYLLHYIYFLNILHTKF